MKFILILLILNFGCINNQNNGEASNDLYQDSVLKPILLEEIMTIWDTSLVDVINQDYSLVVVAFAKEDDDCYLYIIPSPYYSDEKVRGSLKIKDKVFVFYFSDNTCVNSFLNKEILKRNVSLEDYEEEQEFFDQYDVFDPNGLKYRIYNEDSLEIIHKGKF